MTRKPLIVGALVAALVGGAPALAQMQNGAMMADHGKMEMSKSQMMAMHRCKGMSHRTMMRNRKCVAMMKAHPKMMPSHKM